MNKQTNRRSRLNVPNRNDGKSHPSKLGKHVQGATQAVASSEEEKTSPAPKRTKRQLRNLGKLQLVSGVAIVIIGGAVILQLIGENKSADADIDTTQPQYQTALPSGKTVKDLGGWQRISPADKDPVFAYSDSIGPVAISVSQQPLPNAFVGDVDSKLADLAKKFNATNKLSTNDGNLYIGTSAKGPQSALLVKNNTLILIKSQKNIDNQAWIAYVELLGLSY